MEIQLKKSGVSTEFTKNIDLDWATADISRLLKQYANNEYILLFPFCSVKHQNKKWPYFKKLISELKKDYKNKYSILLAPGPKEIEEANKLNIKKLSLETGAGQFFSPARNLFKKCGFKPCKPFAHYKKDDNSVYMSLLISN